MLSKKIKPSLVYICQYSSFKILTYKELFKYVFIKFIISSIAIYRTPTATDKQFFSSKPL